MAEWHEFEYLDSVRIRALDEILHPDSESYILSIFEWYSKEYCTPLWEVQNLPFDHVLLAYYRSYYRNLDSDERHNEAIWLLETPEERAKRQVENKNSEEEFLKKASQQSVSQQSKKGLGTAGLGKKVSAILDKMKAKAGEIPDEDGIGQKVTLAGERPAVTAMPETVLEAGAGDPEEVTIQYMSEEEFEKELDRPLGPTPKPRKR